MDNAYDLMTAHPEMFEQFAVKEVLFLYYTCPQVDKMIRLHSHLNQIGFTLSGKKTLHHGGKSWDATKEKSVFIRKAAYIQEMYESVGWEVLAFYFPDAFLKQVFVEHRQHLPLENLPPPPTDMLIEITLNETTRAFFYSIIPYFNQKTRPSESLLELKFKELLINILSDPSNASLLSYVSSLSDQTKLPIWQTMEANYMFNLTIAEYARMTDRSVASFKREFQEFYKSTPGKWLTNKRLEYAKLLLTTSKKNISEITYDSGFENVSHFSRIFKEKFGVSPLQYRKNQL